jgi:signal transduction histidine kinase
VLTLRTKLLFIVFAAAIGPLALTGVWLTRTAERSGEQLLRSRLDSTLVNVAQTIGQQWVQRRSALLDVAADTMVQRDLELAVAAKPATIPVRIRAGFDSLRTAAEVVVVRDTHERPRFLLASDTSGAPVLVPRTDSAGNAEFDRRGTITVGVTVFRRWSRDTLGAVEARLRTESLIPIGAGSVAGAGAVLAVVDRTTGSSVVPLPFDPSFLSLDRFEWGGTVWLTSRRSLEEPTVDVFAAAPLDPYTAPFQRAGSQGLIALIGVVVTTLLVTTLLTRRVTTSLTQLAVAADAVTRGDLDQQVRVNSHDEVGRVSRAFNTMTESLRGTVRALSQRQAVAAVGEFASALAHEVRNPLSAIRLNMEHLDERLSAHPELRPGVAQALRDIDRLDRTVGGALRVARSGTMELESIELRPVVDAAMRTALPEFSARHAVLGTLPGDTPTVTVSANAAALEQVLLNLLLNAAQALEPRGKAEVSIDADSANVTILVRDNGRGMTPESKARMFEPFFSTKPEGSGLGLTIARRIVTAHRGTISVESAPGEGTVAKVTLPLLASENSKTASQ